MELINRSPGRLVVLFDGTWGFWTRWAQWVRKRDHAGRVLAIPNQLPNVIEHYDLTRADVDWEVWAIAPDGARYNGAAAINQTLHELGGVWRILAAIYRVPGMHWVEKVGYRWVAEHRPFMSVLWGAAPEWDGDSDCA